MPTTSSNRRKLEQVEERLAVVGGQLDHAHLTVTGLVREVHGLRGAVRELLTLEPLLPLAPAVRTPEEAVQRLLEEGQIEPERVRAIVDTYEEETADGE